VLQPAELRAAISGYVSRLAQLYGLLPQPGAGTNDVIRPQKQARSRQKSTRLKKRGN
jgi:hypothetical protein